MAEGFPFPRRSGRCSRCGVLRAVRIGSCNLAPAPRTNQCDMDGVAEDGGRGGIVPG